MKKLKSMGVKISPFTFLFAGIWWIMGNGVMFIVYFISLILHEIAHAVMASRLGYKCEKITISPLGATLYADTDEFSGKDEIRIALSGPLFSLALAALCVAIWWIFPETYNYTMDLCMANFSIFLLNILPIYPLDGGRVLSAKLSLSLQRRKVAKILNVITICFACSLILLSIVSLFFVFNYTFGVIGCFLIISIVSGKKENSYKRVLNLQVKQKKLAKGLNRAQIMVLKSCTLAKVYSFLDSSCYYKIVVVDENFKVLFSVEEARFVEMLKMYSSSMQIGDVCIDKNRFGW